MITRVLATFVVVALGIYAFWGDAMGQGHVLNPFGILFLLLAALVWFGWGPICEGFKSVKNESDIPISRLGSTIIKGMAGLKRGQGRPTLRFLTKLPIRGHRTPGEAGCCAEELTALVEHALLDDLVRPEQHR